MEMLLFKEEIPIDISQSYLFLGFSSSRLDFQIGKIGRQPAWKISLAKSLLNRFYDF